MTDETMTGEQGGLDLVQKRRVAASPPVPEVSLFAVRRGKPRLYRRKAMELNSLM
jgi:hypothetical protein